MKPYFSCLYMFLLLILLFSTIELSVAADSITPATSVRDGQTLVSPSQRFELGFFSPGNSESRYVGIWYKVSPGNVAWVANRNNPIPRPGAVLTVTANGDLVLLNQTNGTIWSININREAQNPVAQLLDTGNLVVRENSSSDSSEDYLWQSFDYPSDTLLPGMRLGWYKKTGRQRYLTSWVSPDDPSPGSFTYRLDIQAVLPQICFYNGSAKLGCAGPWNGEFFGAAPTNPNYVFSPSLVDNEDEIYYMYDSYNDPITMMLKSSLIGKAQRIIWNERTSQWDLVVSFPEYFCEHYGSCGANNFCSQKKTPNCECLKGFTVKSEDNQTCVRSGNDSDCRRGDSFLMYNNTKLPDMQEVSLNKSSNLKDCEAKCLKNCTCRAYATSNVTGEGSGCLMWFGDLIDFREAIESTNGVSIYVRVPASEPGDKKLAWIAVVVVLPLVLLSALYIFCRRRRQLKEKERGQVDSCQDMLLFDTSSGAKEIQDVDRTTDSHNTESWFPIFSFASVSAATDNFSVENKLGEGGFGPVYKGRLLNGEEVAVKRLSANSGQGLEEFRNEMMLIAKLQHRNLVRLFGCCVEQGEKILVYEYLPNNSLDLFLFDPSKKGLLDWETRVRIIDGIAQGLLYLHQYSRLRVIHRDLKASNILLDSDMNAKISDFGMARMFDNDELQSNTNRIVGTYGYMSPEYALQGHFSIKSDVFSFGVLLMEILSGKKNTRFHDSDARTLVGHSWDLWKDDRARVLMDPILETAEPSYVTLKRYINVALLCVQDIPADRPTMSEAVSMLKNEIVNLPFPQRPAFSCARILENSALAAYRGSGDESFSLNRLTISVMDAR